MMDLTPDRKRRLIATGRGQLPRASPARYRRECVWRARAGRRLRALVVRGSRSAMHAARVHRQIAMRRPAGVCRGNEAVRLRQSLIVSAH